MKLLLLLLITLCQVEPIFAQIADFCTYREAINEAEMAIVNDDHEGALNRYYDLLTTSDGNFSNDMYNALILADELNKRDTFFTLMDLVKQKNFSSEYLQDLPVFEHLHTNPRWTAFMAENNAAIVVDTALRARVRQLQVSDRSFRTKEGSYEVHGDTIRKIDSLNMEFIFGLVSTTGLPGEKEIGADSFYGDQGYDIVLHHYCQVLSQGSEMRARYKSMAREDMVVLTDMLITQVQEGRVLPNKCARWLEFQNVGIKTGIMDLCKYSYNGKMSELLVPNYTADDQKAIDEYRKKLCLEPIQDYHRKAVYAASHPEMKFHLDVRMNIFEVSSQEAFDGALKYLRSLE